MSAHAIKRSTQKMRVSNVSIWCSAVPIRSNSDEFGTADQYTGTRDDGEQ
jgi:hypothetical protein